MRSKSPLNRRMNSVAAISCCLLVATGHCFAEQEVRTWTDDTGRHDVEATFVDYVDGNVLLLKDDGSEIAVPLERLSSSDRGYVQYELRRKSINERRRPSSVHASAPMVSRDEEVERISDGSPDAVRVVGDSQELFGVNWHTPVESAFQTAGAGQKEQRPVMWFRVLGDLSGFM